MPDPPLMQNPPVGPQQPPAGNAPVGFDRAFAQRVDATVRWAERYYKVRPRLPGSGGGDMVWAWKAYTGSGGIPAATASDTPGQATVTLSDWNGTKWVPNGNTLPALNSCTTASIPGNTFIDITWVGGQWDATLPCGGSNGSGTSVTRCQCPEDTYEVNGNCGLCGSTTGGTTMPKYWWVTIIANLQYYYGEVNNCQTPCTALTNLTMRITAQTDAYNNTTCEWYGISQSGCIIVELTIDTSYWKLTIMDKYYCVLAVLRKSVYDWNCCGTNGSDGWILQPFSSCNVSVSVAPDQCTCCPDLTCPPANLPVCTTSPCCLTNCSIAVNVFNLYTPAGLPCTGQSGCTDSNGNPCTSGPDCWYWQPPANQKCGGMNGDYGMTWVGDCTWKFKGYPSTNQGVSSTLVTAVLTLYQGIWTFTLQGSGGQTANFASGFWNCAPGISMPYTGGSCPVSGGTPVAGLTVTTS